MDWSQRTFHAGVVLLTLATALVTARGQGRPAGAPEEGVALAIVFDTSGSMKDPVPDTAGRTAPKFLIARRALSNVVDRLEVFLKSSPGAAPRKLQTGLIVFQRDGPGEAVAFGPFKAAPLRDWAGRFNSPGGSTPLGTAVRLAGRKVLASNLSRRHVLVVTDGMNTLGPDPAAIIPQLKQEAENLRTGLSFHFIAFDVDARVFEPLKKLGATVVGAADAEQLNARLEYILQRKILLEDEEPPAKTDSKKP